MEGFPGLAVGVEEVDFSVTVRVLSANEDDFSRGDCQGTAGPEWILTRKNIVMNLIFTYFHSNSQDQPGILLDVVDFDSVIDLLLCAAKEPSERIDELVIHCTRTKIVSLVLHDCHLRPLILLDDVFLD